MKHRILIVSACFLLAACSTGGSDTVTGASPPQTTVHPVGSPPTYGSGVGWSRDTGINNNPGQVNRLQYFENSYSGPYRTGWVFIWAGGKRSDTLAFVQGALWVNINPDSRQSGPESSPPPDSVTNEYDAANSPTWVKITSVTGDIVNLQREDGSTLTFNLQTSQYS